MYFPISHVQQRQWPMAVSVLSSSFYFPFPPIKCTELLLLLATLLLSINAEDSLIALRGKET